MGEVYRARDNTLKRDVALKVLPARLLGDPERRTRFQREAEVLASLDHPYIGPIYGIIDSEESRGLVLALIEGPTLAERIEAGPVPLDEAGAIAKQIIEALEYAHDRGVALAIAAGEVGGDDDLSIHAHGCNAIETSE